MWAHRELAAGYALASLRFAPGEPLRGSLSIDSTKKPQQKLRYFFCGPTGT